MIFLIGLHATGKTDVAHILVREFNFLHVETSSIVRQLKNSIAPHQPIDEWATRAVKEYGRKFIDQHIASGIASAYQKRLLSQPPQEIAITGNRSLYGIEYIMQNLPEAVPNPRRIIVMIEANPGILYQRYITRNREFKDIEKTREDFDEILRRELNSGLSEFNEIVDHYLVNDSNNKTHLMGETVQLFEGVLGYKRGKELL